MLPGILVACCCGEAGSWKTATPFILKIQSIRRPQRIKFTSAGTTAPRATPTHRYRLILFYCDLLVILALVCFKSFFLESLIFSSFFSEAGCQSWWWIINFNMLSLKVLSNMLKQAHWMDSRRLLLCPWTRNHVFLRVPEAGSSRLIQAHPGASRRIHCRLLGRHRNKATSKKWMTSLVIVMF